MRSAFDKAYASLTGVEVSHYLCKPYGWNAGSAVDFRTNKPFDLAAASILTSLSALLSGHWIAWTRPGRRLIRMQRWTS